MTIEVNVISYLDPYEFHGGGEQCHRELLRRAPGDLDIRRLHAIGRQDFLHDNPDLTILHDVFNSPEHAARFPRRFASRLPYLRMGRYRCALNRAMGSAERLAWFMNAYVDICDRGYFPCGGFVDQSLEMCARPDVKAGRHFLRTDNGTRCFSYYTSSFLRRANQIWFLSPLHKEAWLSRGGAYLRNDIALEMMIPGIQPEPFVACRRPFAERDIEALFVGSFTESKGAREAVERFGSALVVCGNAQPWVEERGVRVLGWRSTEAVAELMGRARKYVMLPTWPEPFGRVVAEAAIAGCELVTNDNVGAMSWGVDLRDPDVYGRSASSCWSKLLAGLQ